MSGPLSSLIDAIGAHRHPQRVEHERDRAVQRVIIASLIALAAGWVLASDGPARAPILLVALTLAYALVTAVYWRRLGHSPHDLRHAQLAFIILDPALTVLALASAPDLLAPWSPLLAVQVIRCGIRYGLGALWVGWGAAILASMALLPLNPFWHEEQQLVRTYAVMLLVTPAMFLGLIRHLHQMTAALRTAATSDPLTGLGNRRVLEEHLRLARERCQRERSLLAVMMIDLDNFKSVNDIEGHAMGDRLLEAIARAIQASCRAGDFLARIGGDEFVLVIEGLPVGNGPQQAERIARKLVEVVGATAANLCPGTSVSASIGVQCWRSTASDAKPTAPDLIAAADAAMYSAKRAGKSRVVMLPV